jgi:hypothetical protein
MHTVLMLLSGLSACHKTDTDAVDTDVTPGDTDDTDVPVDTDVGDTDDTDVVDTDTDTAPPRFPDCETVSGFSAVWFTKDEGATMSALERPMSGTGYTYGLVVMPDDASTLYAVHDAELWKSEDAGCSWAKIGDFSDTLVHLDSVGGDRVWGYRENGSFIARIDADVITELPVETYPLGLGIDRSDADHVRWGDWTGQLWETTDGQHFAAIGTPPWGYGNYAYWSAFDPQDLDHVVVGGLASTAYVTTDGGQHWTPATGFGATTANIFTLTISPVDGDIVWAEGIDFEELDSGAANEGRHIWRSDDGGVTFTRVVEASADVTLINGPHMAASPTDEDVLYFEFGTYYAAYGTDLFRYDAGTQRLTKTHNDAHGIDAFAFSPADPTLMYLGMAHEEVN